MFFSVATALFSALPLLASAQVTATGANGPTNPSAPAFDAVGSTVNQTSYSRLATLNNVNDFCLFGPPVAGADSTIGDLEAVVVAYCTQPRNGARLIPDGTITSAHFIKTPLYVQVSGTWDGTKVDFVSGDYGGELDPHGATGEGNPVGGNVTSNVSGEDVFYEEWMMYTAADSFCFRICTAEDTANGITAALQCEHVLDEMGCNFVMAIPYDLPATFDDCNGDAAAPPGLYPLANGSTSTFRQRYTGEWTVGTTFTGTFTVGETVTPSAPYSYPATSQCTSYASISNGVNTANFAVESIVSSASPTATNTGTQAVSMNSTLGATSNSTTVASTSASSSMTTSKASTTTKAASTGAAASASSATSAAGSSGAALRGSMVWGMDGTLVTVGGITFAGLVAGMAVLL